VLRLVDLGNLEHLGVDVLERVEAGLELPVLVGEPLGVSSRPLACGTARAPNLLRDAIGRDVAKALTGMNQLLCMEVQSGLLASTQEHQRAMQQLTESPGPCYGGSC
jgi:hypothetical protein